MISKGLRAGGAGRQPSDNLGQKREGAWIARICDYGKKTF